MAAEFEITVEVTVTQVIAIHFQAAHLVNTCVAPAVVVAYLINEFRELGCYELGLDGDVNRVGERFSPCENGGVLDSCWYVAEVAPLP